ncbi:FMN-dependent NADH-azoreductase [Epilithonimonas arachidiradicis]|uniref:FMN dependent NADH:quinone oxidoreductase n=1 Tax=Epilithonimonas arachidiradicis TaxID=1617282 RepID=A0A420D8H4_9FLAO|nr:NAD(P)H-dependent oxidoreductase [Epilithonimonas arachidiradicis]RKE86970.1 FMN-dependent NADH-azoreductase [Epilithonimonas arachidiradicis]GGG60747.1 FMN-dependent NADH-azoreductase [Epilithonimonas arachidiradicis]
MKNVLHIITSPRKDLSASRKLGKAVIEKIQEKYSDTVLKERDLTTNPTPLLDESHINTFFTPAENHSTEQQSINKYSEDLISELKEADIIVIDSPMYNFSVTATLRAYLDFTSRAGYTFKYDENGPKGLLNDKKLYIAFTSGNIYSEGPFQVFDSNVPYIKNVFGFYGVSDVSVFRAEGLAIPGIMENALNKGIESIVID